MGAGRRRYRGDPARHGWRELRRHELRAAARRRHDLLVHPEHERDALELRGGAGLSQERAAVWRPLVLHELASPTTFNDLCRAAWQASALPGIGAQVGGHACRGTSAPSTTATSTRLSS